MDPSNIFEQFAQASTFRAIQQTFFQLCTTMDIDMSNASEIYEKIRELDRGKSYSKADKLWTLIDKRRNQPVYCSQKACNRLNILIVGAGPCGLRAAIEYALLGAHVVVVEQRDKFSRNNVLHLWDFVIQDLKALGAKIFYPKFCTGSIDHISIRRLQCLLLKVALVLGVQVHENINFLGLIEPPKDQSGRGCGWRANIQPHDHILSEYEYDVIVGADGKRNTIPGFPRQVVRGKVAIGITANFVNGRTPMEEKVQEISGVAYIFNQTFFKEMLQATGIDLENIVYYKDDTHYFVMCAKKQSLLQKGVIKQDYEDIATLLSPDNVDQEMLCKYAAQAADFATNGKLPQLVFAQNARSQPDVAMFDFTALYSAVYSTRLLERNSKHLILTIVGDSLHEPFWPTGSGIGRGFLGVFDSAWMLRSFGLNKAGPTEIIAERENIYKFLAQTTKENMCKQISEYTIDPTTRYKRIEYTVEPDHVCEQVDTDNPRLRPTSKPLTLRVSPPPSDCESAENLPQEFARKYRLWMICHQILLPFKLKMFNFKTQSWGDGRALAALVGKFRSDLVDYLGLCAGSDPSAMIEHIFTVAESEFQITRPCRDQHEWTRLPENSRVDFIEKVVDAIFTSQVVDENGPSSSSVKSHQNGESIVPRFAGRNGVPEKATRRSDKLNPKLLCRVEQIVSGSLEKQRHKELFDQKYTTSQRLAQKMEKENLEKLEKKFEQVDMGQEKERNPSMSTQEEKVMQLSAADARLRAKEGFCTKNRFEEVDKKINSAKDSLKFASLAGVNVVSQFRQQDASPKFIGPPPAPPPKTTSLLIDDSFQNRALVNNGNHEETLSSAPSVSNVDVVTTNKRASAQFENLTRRQQCRICGLDVYLAEQMFVEKMTIHKSCFKCSYCGQPLRLDNCALDRELQGNGYGCKWFCRQHMMLPYSEKVSRLEKQRRKSAVNQANREGPCVAVVSPTRVCTYKDEKIDSDNMKSERNGHKNQSAISVAPNEFNVTDSPTTLVSKAMEKIRSRDIASSLMFPSTNYNSARSPIEATNESHKDEAKTVRITRNPSERVGLEFRHKHRRPDVVASSSTSISSESSEEDHESPINNSTEEESLKLRNRRRSQMLDAIKQLKSKEDQASNNNGLRTSNLGIRRERDIQPLNETSPQHCDAVDADCVWHEFVEMLEEITSREFLGSLTLSQARDLIEHVKWIKCNRNSEESDNSLIFGTQTPKAGNLQTSTSNNSLYFTPRDHSGNEGPDTSFKRRSVPTFRDSYSTAESHSPQTPTRSESGKEADMLKRIQRIRLQRNNPRRSTVGFYPEHSRTTS
ncbi:[F-actin]-methionine sulfoxide oxidase MICAL3 [Ditylenchus destructor]|uniref:F-actin monooxygenase n=1 Tax=Ditylenchus destructor TaxID=166010 RepID=A0AAD4N4B6_9BILA|nr:[F-actin]-methionine sulfoxide oxidase MICAL3 [Ditylenchus destructor]